MLVANEVDRFHRLLWPHCDAISRTARFLCRNAHETEDLVQETFTKAFRALAQLTDERGAISWLMTILRHARVDSVRAQITHPTVSLTTIDIDPPCPTCSPATSSDMSSDALLEELSDHVLIATLRMLPAETRWTLLLVDVNSMSHVEAATIQGVTPGTIKSRTRRGHMAMRDMLLERQSAPARRGLCLATV